MRVSSDLADLRVELGAIRREGTELVIDSAPGSSIDTRIRVGAAEARRMLGKVLGSGAVWAFALRLPFARGAGSRGQSAQKQAGGAKDNPAWRKRRDSVGLNKPW